MERNYEEEERECIQSESVGSQSADNSTESGALSRVSEILTTPPPGLRQASCSHCGDDGLVFRTDSKGYRVIIACLCRYGDKHAEPKYRPSDSKKEFPIQIERAKKEKKDWMKDF